MAFNVTYNLTWIDTDEALSVYCQKWQSSVKRLALDTEFIRRDTLHPQSALIQIYDGDRVTLIDPLKVSDFSPLARVLNCSEIEKIFHGCAEDLCILHLLSHEIAHPIFDTQIAAAFCGLGSSVSYQHLAKRLLGVDLDKTQTRSNWLERPLTPGQKRYAAQDVLGLLTLREQLKHQLQLLGRYSWFVDECTQKEQTVLASTQLNADQAYSRVKLAWQLKASELNILKHLAAWREKTAWIQNRPRAFFLTDSQLLFLARRRPQHLAAIPESSGIAPAVIRQWGTVWTELIRNGLVESSDVWPVPLDKPLPLKAKAWLKLLKAECDHCALELGLPTEFLAAKKALVALLRSGYPSGPFDFVGCLNGWRLELLKPHLEPILAKLVRSEAANELP